MRSSRRARAGRLPLLRVAVGADHGGFSLKAKVIAWLKAKGLEVADMGTHSEQPCDYPQVAYKVSRAVARGEFDRGVLICKTGIGIAMAANKVPRVRAGVCSDVLDAQRSRAHNDANVLVLGAEKTAQVMARRIVEAWFATPFEVSGRHARRVRQMAAIEAAVLKAEGRVERLPAAKVKVNAKTV